MSKKAIVLSRKGAVALGALQLAMDAKLVQGKAIDLTPLFDGVTNKNFKDSKPKIVAGLKKIVTKDMLAMDMTLDDVAELLDKVEKVEPAEGVDAEGVAVTEPSAAMPQNMLKGLDAAKEFLKGKISEDDMGAFSDMMGGGEAEDEDETEEEKKKREAEKAAQDKAAADKAAKDEADKEEKDKKAMDSAIQTAVKTERENQRKLRIALDDVRPYVGELAPTLALDSAEQVYRHAGEMLGIDDAKTIHASALKTLILLQPKPGTRQAAPSLAMDSATQKGFFDRYPNAKRITVGA